MASHKLFVMLGLSHFLALLPRHQSLALDLLHSSHARWNAIIFSFLSSRLIAIKRWKQNWGLKTIWFLSLLFCLSICLSARFPAGMGFLFVFPILRQKKVRFGLETTKWFCSTKNSGNQTSKSRRRKKSKQITRASASVIQSNFYYPTNKCQFFSHRTYAARAT